MAIVPDTKDWTWVLERRCPECGFDARSVAPSTVAAALRRATQTWVDVLARADVAQRPSDDRWSPLEYACHVRDVFVLYRERLELMLTVDDPPFANWDQDATAVERRYGEADPRHVASALRMAGAALADGFDTVGTDGWSRTGRRSDGATFSIDTFSRYLLHDVVHHLWDVGATDPPVSRDRLGDAGTA